MLRVPLLLPLPIRSEVQIPAPRAQRNVAMDVTPFPLLLGRSDEVDALGDLGDVGNVPLLPPVDTLDIIASVAAFALVASTVARAAFLLVVDLLITPAGEPSPLGGLAVVVVGVIVVGVVVPILGQFLGLLEGAQLVLPGEGPPQLETTLPPDCIPVLVQPMLPHPVPFVDVEALALPPWDVGSFASVASKANGMWRKVTLNSTSSPLGLWGITRTWSRNVGVRLYVYSEEMRHRAKTTVRRERRAPDTVRMRNSDET